jgi:hypothetical protein
LVAALILRAFGRVVANQIGIAGNIAADHLSVTLEKKLLYQSNSIPRRGVYDLYEIQ